MKGLNLWLVLLTFTACSNKNLDPNFVSQGSVKKIILPDREPLFPDKPGKDLFTSNCRTCHSLRYISAQPNLPRKVWHAEVIKMIDKYKAPIDTSNITPIVNYLVSVKGTK